MAQLKSKHKNNSDVTIEMKETKTIAMAQLK
jgi:hypothetical protein